MITFLGHMVQLNKYVTADNEENVLTWHKRISGNRSESRVYYLSRGQRNFIKFIPFSCVFVAMELDLRQKYQTRYHSFKDTF